LCNEGTLITLRDNHFALLFFFIPVICHRAFIVDLNSWSSVAKISRLAAGNGGEIPGRRFFDKKLCLC
jgi:hypothetical protein